MKVEVEQGVPELDIPTPEELEASAVQFLLSGEDYDAASVLISCRVSMSPIGKVDWFDGYWSAGVEIVIEAPRLAYDVLEGGSTQEGTNPVKLSILRALRAFRPIHAWIETITVRAALDRAMPPNWREEFEQANRSRGVNNQGKPIDNASTIWWESLRFRSHSEVRIADAIQTRIVLFLPNCMARLRKKDGFGNLEPDFLVCCDGKWGIIEVDGEPFHPPTRTAVEQTRDRYFKAHGLMVVERYPADECYNHAARVVDGFLEILKRSKA